VGTVTILSGLGGVGSRDVRVCERAAGVITVFLVRVTDVAEVFGGMLEVERCGVVSSEDVG
jgi:hypothetical protein